MPNTIKLTESEWAQISEQLAQEYPPSYQLIRSVMRKELGFTVRQHRRWLPGAQPGSYCPRDEIHLDFYDGAQESWFRLKYLNTRT